jgi:hypothetical protein
MATCYCPVITSPTAGQGVKLSMGLVIPESLCGSKDSVGKYIDYCSSSAFTWNSGPAQLVTVMLALLPGEICSANSFP